MRLILVQVVQVVIFACLWSETISDKFDSDQEIWNDLMVGRMWYMNDTGSFGNIHDGSDEYKAAFENFDSDFEEFNKEDLQEKEPLLKPEQHVVVLKKDTDNEQYDDQYDEQDEDDEDDEDEQKPKNGTEMALKKQKGSLVIVFDTTMSMSQELIEVKKGAKAIVNALSKHPEAPIYNYIFSPFNDPEVGPLTVTTNPEFLEEKMNEIIVHGGGDCPELSLTALKNALDACLPNSKVYVFTDAPPKDVKLYKDVVTLVQRKRAEVSFILTKGCISQNLDKLWPYDYIAQTSSGHLYKVKMTDLKNILNFVKITLQRDEVQLMSVNKQPTSAEKSEEIPLLIDPSIKEFTVSVSGLKTKVSLTNERGKQPEKMEEPLNLSHLKVYKIKHFHSGLWKIKVECKYPYMVRVTAISTLTFNYGFSLSETDNIKNTNHRPLKDAKNFILIKTTDLKKEFNFTDVEILNLRGTVIQSLPLVHLEGEGNLYRAGSFIPPNKFFNLRLNGISRSGMKVSRLSSTAISPQSLGPPIVTMRKTAVRKLNKRGTINCDIESLAPVVIGWMKNGKPVDKRQICSESCEAILHFRYFTYKAQGNYTCFANNTAGYDDKILQLHVGNPPLVKGLSPVVAQVGKNATLTCDVKSELKHKITWTKLSADVRKESQPLVKGKVEKNFDLTIPFLKKEDAGSYVCKVSNRAGKATAQVELEVKEN